MADEGNVKTPLSALQDTLSRLKEMSHYSQTNIEKLATLWLEVSEHKEQKQYEKMVDEVLKRQNQFQKSMTPLIEAYENEIARLKAEAEWPSRMSP
jgi:phage shock protein A